MVPVTNANVIQLPMQTSSLRQSIVPVDQLYQLSACWSQHLPDQCKLTEDAGDDDVDLPGEPVHCVRLRLPHDRQNEHLFQCVRLGLHHGSQNEHLFPGTDTNNEHLFAGTAQQHCSRQLTCDSNEA